MPQRYDVIVLEHDGGYLLVMDHGDGRHQVLATCSERGHAARLLSALRKHWRHDG